MKSKHEMAHDYAIEMLKRGDPEHKIASDAWNLADAMKDQFEKRERLAAEEHRKFMDVLTKPPVKEWHPDWSQAPDWANWYAVDKNGQGIWHNLEPSRDQSMVEWVIDFSSGSDFSYKISPDFNYQGDWKDSLRKRP